MAKSRTRERSSPPPRSNGAGLMAVALLGSLIAVIGGVIGAFMAGNTKDDSGSQIADSVGAGLVSVLTSSDPSTWHKDFGTTKEARATLERYYKSVELGEFTDKGKKNKQMRDGRMMARNKDRLDNVADLFNNGAFVGLAVVSLDPKVMSDHNIGARIDTSAFATGRQLLNNVSVADMTAGQPAGGTFPARVYHRAYKNVYGKTVGNAYVIIAKSALVGKSGPGSWLFITPLLVAIGVGLFLMYAMKFVDGIKTLARDLDTIGRGRFDVRVQTNGAGEVALAQRTADRMVKNLQLIQQTGSGDLDEAIEKELDTASQIHESLRPSDPPRVLGYELETLFRAGRDIGGDYYDYIELDEKRVALLIADCSESLRGVPAAMVMAMTRAYLRAAIDGETSPADWLRSVNRRLARDLKSGMAVTALAVVVDTSTHEVIAASAGHRPIVMWRQGKTATINPSGIALGLDVGPVFNKTMEEKKFTLAKNDRIVLYTDGVIAAQQEGGESYGEQRFLDAIRRQGAMNSAAFVNFIAAGVDKFVGEAEQNDDITICTLKRMK